MAVPAAHEDQMLERRYGVVRSRSLHRSAIYICIYVYICSPRPTQQEKEERSRENSPASATHPHTQRLSKQTSQDNQSRGNHKKLGRRLVQQSTQPTERGGIYIYSYTVTPLSIPFGSVRNHLVPYEEQRFLNSIIHTYVYIF